MGKGLRTINGNPSAPPYSGEEHTWDTTLAHRKEFEILASGNKTLTADMSGRTFMATASSGTPTFTLPAATNKGCIFTFINGHASNEILINPGTGFKIRCKTTVDQGTSVAPAATTGIKNTAATDVIGDLITLIADGTDTWHMVAQSGIWASQ